MALVSSAPCAAAAVVGAVATTPMHTAALAASATSDAGEPAVEFEWATTRDVGSRCGVSGLVMVEVWVMVRFGSNRTVPVEPARHDGFGNISSHN